MDDADKADLQQQASLDAAIAAARGIPSVPGRYCRDCDEDLPVHRREWGICWACQARREAMERRMGRRL